MTYTVETILTLLNTDISQAYRGVLLNQLKYVSNEAYLNYTRGL
jgi:hypothetical protein